MSNQASRPAATPAMPGVQQQIPFRAEGESLADGAINALLVLVLLLAAVLAVLWVAKRRGWLEKWTGQVLPLQTPSIRIEQRLRLSPRTMLYRVQDGRSSYLVLESSVNAKLCPIEPMSEEKDV